MPLVEECHGMCKRGIETVDGASRLVAEARKRCTCVSDRVNTPVFAEHFSGGTLSRAAQCARPYAWGGNRGYVFCSLHLVSFRNLEARAQPLDRRNGNIYGTVFSLVRDSVNCGWENGNHRTGSKLGCASANSWAESQPGQNIQTLSYKPCNATELHSL